MSSYTNLHVGSGLLSIRETDGAVTSRFRAHTAILMPHLTTPPLPCTRTRIVALQLVVALLAGGGCSAARDAAPVADTPDTTAALRPAPVSVMPVQLDPIAGRTGAVVTGIVVRRDTTSFGVGPAVVTLRSGDTVVVSDSAYRVWKLDAGSLVAVSGLDGAGGYENEGQSLTVIDMSTGTRRRVLADYFPIVRVELLEVSGRRALLVHMRDGGQGGLHVSVVDPKRGQVFRALHALGRISGAQILVSGFGDGDLPVEFGDRRTPLRVDSIAVAAVDTMSLLVVPRSPR